MRNILNLSFSPCPNDTFIFDAMVHGKIDTEFFSFNYSMADVEELNRRTFSLTPDMTKLSFHAWLYVRKYYHLLSAGSALGFGNGPLLISKRAIDPFKITTESIAIPGDFTTANLLLKFMLPNAKNKKVMVFNQIEEAVLKGEVDAGVIIHENRFTYEQRGLRKLYDLGQYWEEKTSLPIPLGGIVVRKNLGPLVIKPIERAMRKSVEYALKHPRSSADFVKQNAQEMDDEVIQKHINLYVNQYTVDLGEKGREAIQFLTTLKL